MMQTMSSPTLLAMRRSVRTPCWQAARKRIASSDVGLNQVLRGSRQEAPDVVALSHLTILC